MTTTVTTTTITTLGQATALGVVAAILLVALLANKQFVAGSSNEHLRRLSSALNIVIIPFTMVFVVTAIMKLVTALQ